MIQSSRFIVTVLFAVLLLTAGCGKKQDETAQQNMPQQGMQQGEIRQGPSNAAAGIRWTAPSSWKELPARQMRIVTYSVPAKGRSDAGECGVFFFGRGEGGDVEANIGRWVSQFENPGQAVRSVKTVDGMNVTLVKVGGTYLAPAGPMMQSQGKKPNYKLVGAIVDAPDGSVFFKFIGPAETVDAAEKDFNALIDSITKQSKVS